ncbi:MAG: DUF3017 domain-containing protein [Actinomycetes bacterium]
MSVDPAPPRLPEPPFRRPQTFGGVVYIAVVAMALIGLVIVVAGPWRTGVIWLGSGLLVAAVTRLGLSEHAAGMLRVRRKWSDVLMLTVAGIALVVLAIVVPNQPGV